jgi:hypothetical protein
MYTPLCCCWNTIISYDHQVFSQTNDPDSGGIHTLDASEEDEEYYGNVEVVEVQQTTDAGEGVKPMSQLVRESPYASEYRWGFRMHRRYAKRWSCNWWLTRPYLLFLVPRVLQFVQEWRDQFSGHRYLRYLH